jgi:predicted nucleotidyltransferase
MVETQTRIRQLAREFIKKLESEITVEKVVLYGSYARGDAHAESDIDLAIISRNLAQLDPIQRIQMIARHQVGCDTRLAPFGYSLGEYNRAQPWTFLGEIKRTGKVIYTRRKRRARSVARKNRKANDQ